jgi:glucose-6-phosphate-specific signal transduction histidine kinase
MARIILDTTDKETVRRVRQMVRKWFGRDAEMVFGEATDNVLHHTDHKRAEISLHAQSFRVTNNGPPPTSEDLTKFITNEHRQSGYGLLIMSALGGDINLSQDGTWVEWKREENIVST